MCCSRLSRQGVEKASLETCATVGQKESDLNGLALLCPSQGPLLLRTLHLTNLVTMVRANAVWHTDAVPIESLRSLRSFHCFHGLASVTLQLFHFFAKKDNWNYLDPGNRHYFSKFQQRQRQGKASVRSQGIWAALRGDLLKIDLKSLHTPKLDIELCVLLPFTLRSPLACWAVASRISVAPRTETQGSGRSWSCLRLILLWRYGRLRRIWLLFAG